MGVPVRTSFAAARREKMAQRRADDGHWQLSFADMMTLLLAFFMVLLSVSAVDLERYLEVAESMNRAMGSKSQPVASQKGTLRAIKKQVQESMGPIAHAVILEDRPDAVAIHLKGGFFFESGSAELSVKAVPFLDLLGLTLSAFPYQVAVEGHTDDVPIKSDKYPSNWELSAARASAVARHIIAKGLPAEQVEVVGLAAVHPLVPNEDEYGNPLPLNQAKNRRVVILLKPPAYR